MEIYSVVAVVENFDLDDEAQLAGLDCLSYPALAGRTGGVTTIDGEVAADSPISALTQFMSDLRQAGVSVKRFDLDMVSVSEIALRLDVSRETVRLWTQGKRRSGFPEAFTVAGETTLWRWSDVHPWVMTQGIQVDDLLPIPGDIVDPYNGALAQVRATSDEGWFTATTQPQRPISPLDHTRQGRPAHRWVSPATSERDAG